MDAVSVSDAAGLVKLDRRSSLFAYMLLSRKTAGSVCSCAFFISCANSDVCSHAGSPSNARLHQPGIGCDCGPPPTA